MTELYEYSLVETAIGIREGTTSPVALVKSCLARIKELEPKLHAWVTVMEEDAIHEASICEAEARGEKFRGPLHGIPIGVKDIFHTKGVVTEAGSKAFAGFIPDDDAYIVARLKQAGAIILGKTVTTELAMSDPKDTRTHARWIKQRLRRGSCCHDVSGRYWFVNRGVNIETCRLLRYRGV